MDIFQKHNLRNTRILTCDTCIKMESWKDILVASISVLICSRPKWKSNDHFYLLQAGCTSVRELQQHLGLKRRVLLESCRALIDLVEERTHILPTAKEVKCRREYRPLLNSAEPFVEGASLNHLLLSPVGIATIKSH